MNEPRLDLDCIQHRLATIAISCQWIAFGDATVFAINRHGHVFRTFKFLDFVAGIERQETDSRFDLFPCFPKLQISREKFLKNHFHISNPV